MDFVIGEVLSAGAGGLELLAEGLSLSGSDLWINEALLPGYSPALAGVLTIRDSFDNVVATVTATPGSLTRAFSPLAAGDRVVLLTTDHQTYYLICKVVRYG